MVRTATIELITFVYTEWLQKDSKEIMDTVFDKSKWESPWLTTRLDYNVTKKGQRYLKQANIVDTSILIDPLIV